MADGHDHGAPGSGAGDEGHAVALALRDGGEPCVCDLAWVCERSDKLVSHHVRVLRTAGLVRSRREGKMVLYQLTVLGEDLLDAIIGTRAEVAG